MKDTITHLITCFFLLSSIASAGARIAPPLTEQVNLKATEHSAEILYSMSQTVLAEDHHWSGVTYVSVRLNDLEAARDYGRISIPFNHYYSDTQLDFANVRAKDGSMSAVSDDAVQLRVTGGGQDFYSDSSEIVFSLPDVAPGSIIEFQYSSRSKELALPELYSERVSPYWFQRTVGGDGWRVDYVHHHHYLLSTPPAVEIYEKFYNDYAKKAKVSKQDTQTTRSWSLRAVPPIASESWMPELRELAPGLFISTQKDWSVIAQWTWKNVVEKFEPTEKLRKIAASFQLAEDASVQDKARAVYEYLQKNVRYVFAHLGRGGYEPHFAADVLEASYGDCKDQTILAVALLRLLDVPALPALIETPRSGKNDTDLVSQIFDHMMIYIPESQNSAAIWLDTTGDHSLYPGVSNYLQNQTALIIDGQGGQLTKMLEGFEDNFAILEMNYQQNDDNKLIVTADIQLSGYFEQNLRSWWIHDQNSESDLDKYIKSIFTNTDEYTVTASLNHSEDLWQPVNIKATFTFAEQKDTPPFYGASFAQNFRIFGHLSDLQTPQTRIHRFVDDYPFYLLLKAHMHGSQELIPTVVQSSGDIRSDFISLRQSGHVVGDDYRLESRMDKPALNLSPSQYTAYYNTLEQISRVDPWLISMQPNTEIASQKALDEIKMSEGAESLQYIIAMARDQIGSGEYEDALSNAQKAVSLDSNNGEAWYLLGMSQSFNSLIDESNRSFERAASLGFLP